MGGQLSRQVVKQPRRRNIPSRAGPTIVIGATILLIGEHPRACGATFGQSLWRIKEPLNKSK